MAAVAHRAGLNKLALPPAGVLPALGIDLGGTKIEAVLLAPAGGQLVWRQRVATPAGDYAGTVRALAALCEQARSQAGGAVSIGIGAPGTCTAAGLMKNCNSTCLNGQPLQADLQTALGQPVALANDANCLALSEATDGAGAGADVVFAAILGTGTGAGIAVHGRILQGANGLAGEWGHNPLPWASADEQSTAFVCYCGQRGCVESWVSGPGLARDHAGAAAATTDANANASTNANANANVNTSTSVNASAIAAAAVAGDAACAATLARHAQRLARALAATINLLDPDVIVLGGGLSRMAHLYSDVPRLWGRWVFGASADEPVRTRLLPAVHGDASGVRGAAWLGRSVANVATGAATSAAHRPQ